MPDLYQNHSCDPKTNAQRNLCGRTHYVDDDTLRFHKSRVISARHTAGGLLFAIVTSDALDMHNTRRGFRYVIFDLFGHVLARTELEHAHRTSQKTTEAMWAELDGIEATKVTAEGIAREDHSHADEMQRVRDDMARMIAGGLARVAA